MKLDIEKLKEIAVEAGKIVMKYYNEDYHVKTKDDDSPVTEAYFAANEYIVSSLTKLYPNIAIISEEHPDEENLKLRDKKELFLIDPIDGTKAFIRKKSQFTINIAYIKDKKFILGFIYVPILDILYYSDYQNSYKITNYNTQQKVKILTKENNDLDEGIIQTSSLGKSEREILAKEFQDIKIKDNIYMTSSYKFCLIAEGVADFYPRRGGMKIWDVAAAFGILKFLDYKFLDLEGNEITFDDMIKDLSLSDFNLFRSQKVLNYFDFSSKYLL